MRRSALVSLLIVSCLGGLLGGWLQADDEITPRKGTPRRGKIKSMTAQEVSIEVGGKTEAIPVNEIEMISFDGEPAKLRTVTRRTAMGRGPFEQALKDLDQMVSEGVTANMVKQDIDYLRANSTGQLALRGDKDLAQAVQMAKDFVSKNTNNYHYFDACALLGDLQLAAGDTAGAIDAYDRLAAAPWPDYKLRGLVAVGRAKQQKKDVAGARSAFESALQLATGADHMAHKLAATLGKAECLADEGQTAGAIKAVEQVIIDATDPEDVELHARAYNTLGRCYLKTEDHKRALLAFLHVELMYNTNVPLHTEAVNNLITIYTKLGDKAGVARMEQRLKGRAAKPKAGS